MEQGIALVEPLLHFGLLGGDGEVGFADPVHRPGLLPGALVERVALHGVAGLAEFGGVGLRVQAARE